MTIPNRIMLSMLCMIAACNAAHAFTTEDVKVTNRTDSVTLAGTLAAPEHNPKAALVLATGSGPQNRDEEVLGHKPFKAIAEFLAENGYVVLRMDDRGTGESSGDFSTADNNGFTRDVNAGLHFLAERYPHCRVGVLGHSEGGTIAIKNAVSDPACDFIITLAAPAWEGDSIIMSQSRALATALTGRWDKESDQRRILDVVISNLPDVQARMALSFILNGIYGDAAALPQTQQIIAKQLDSLLSKWYRDMVRYNPANDIASVNVPWLALNGDRDTQVLPGNLATIKELNNKADTMLMPGHNHLFQHCSSGLVTEYQTLTDDISSDTLEAILQWLNGLVE